MKVINKTKNRNTRREKQDNKKVSGKSCNNSISLISNTRTEELRGTDDNHDITDSRILEHGNKRLFRCKHLIRKSLFNQEFRSDECIACSNEGTTRGDTSRFHSFISHLVEYIEIVKTLKRFLPKVSCC